MKSRRVQRRVFRVPRPETQRDLPRPAPPAPADFTSQQLGTPRHALLGEALVAYERGLRMTVRRLPAGYRKTIVT